MNATNIKHVLLAKSVYFRCSKYQIVVAEWVCFCLSLVLSVLGGQSGCSWEPRQDRDETKPAHYLCSEEQVFMRFPMELGPLFFVRVDPYTFRRRFFEPVNVLFGL